MAYITFCKIQSDSLSANDNSVTYHTLVALEFSFAYKYSKFNLILQFVLRHFNLLSYKQQRDGEMWLKTQMKKVISMIRKWAILYM